MKQVKLLLLFSFLCIGMTTQAGDIFKHIEKLKLEKVLRDIGEEQINKISENGDSALHTALKKAIVLQRLGKDTRIILDIIILLLENQINTELKDRNGRTAFDLVTSEGNEELLEILKPTAPNPLAQASGSSTPHQHLNIQNIRGGKGRRSSLSSGYSPRSESPYIDPSEIRSVPRRRSAPPVPPRNFHTASEFDALPEIRTFNAIGDRTIEEDIYASEDILPTERRIRRPRGNSAPPYVRQQDPLLEAHVDEIPLERIAREEAELLAIDNERIRRKKEIAEMLLIRRRRESKEEDDEEVARDLARRQRALSRNEKEPTPEDGTN